MHHSKKGLVQIDTHHLGNGRDGEKQTENVMVGVQKEDVVQNLNRSKTWAGGAEGTESTSHYLEEKTRPYEEKSSREGRSLVQS